MKFSSAQHDGQRRICTMAAVALTSLLAFTACAPSSAAPDRDAAEATELGILDSEYSLDALIAAAKTEEPITVYDVTGKIVETAENFTALYGIEAIGVKAKAGEQQELLTREAQAKNVTSDVFFMTDTPAAVATLIPQNIATSWFPPDLVDQVPAAFQNPAVVAQEANVWTYNTEVYGDTCPINNIWALTTADWAGKVSIQDPLLRTDFMYWMNQSETHGDDQFAEAYEDYFGVPLKTDEDSATAEWVKGFAANNPLLAKGDGDVAEVVGAPGQTEPFMAFMSTAEFRENTSSGFKLGLCSDVNPWSGRSYSKTVLIASGTHSPNAAKLFVHYMFTEDGIAPQLVDGKISTNSTVPVSPDEPSGVEAVWDQIFTPDPTTSADDFARLADWQDFWTINS